MYLRSTLCAVSFLALASAAFAAPATPEGAARITAKLQSYFPAAGVVTVTPQGDTYELKLDPAPLFEGKDEKALNVTISPFVLNLTDNGDGTWRVREDQSLSGSFGAPDSFVTTFTVGRIVSDGIWDEKIGGFVTNHSEMTDYVSTSTHYMEQSVSQEDDVAKVEAVEIGKISSSVKSNIIDITGSAGVTGGYDAKIKYLVNDVATNYEFPGSEWDPPATYKVSYANSTSDADLVGLRTNEIYKVANFLVANLQEHADLVKEAEARALIRESLPVFKSFKTDSSINDISVEGLMGPIQLETVSGTTELNGIVSDGRVRQSIHAKGLKLPPELVPEWAANLVPTELDLDVTASGFDLATPALTYLNAEYSETTGEGPEGLDELALQQLLPNGVADIVLAPGSVIAPSYTLGFEGKMKTDFQNNATGTARVTSTDLDKVMTEIAKAPEDVAGQMQMSIGMAKGFAKQEGGLYVWDIDASEPGKLLINGVDMFGMQ